MSINFDKNLNNISVDIINHKMEDKKDIFPLFITSLIISFWAMMKYYFLHNILSIDREVIRKKFYGNLFVDRTSDLMRNLRIHARTWRAMNFLYNYKSIFAHKNFFQKQIEYFWAQIDNSKAIRNRARVVKKLTQEEVAKRNKSEEINILSIASGTGQPLIEAVAKFNQYKINLTLIDKDQDCLDFAQKIAQKYDLTIKTICEDIFNLDKLKLEKFDLVEMIGIFDYFSEEQTNSLTRKLKQITKNSTSVIISNSCPNRGSFGLTWVMLWPLIYRDESDFKSLLLSSGYSDIKIVYEPLKFHLVAVCKI